MCDFCILDYYADLSMTVTFNSHLAPKNIAQQDNSFKKPHNVRDCRVDKVKIAGKLTCCNGALAFLLHLKDNIFPQLVLFTKIMF